MASRIERPPCWVFLRGLARESAHWEDFPRRFAGSIPNAGVLLVDLPGNGKHWRLDSPTDMAAMVEFARGEVADAGRQVEGPVMLFAVSLGAMVALEWLRRHPAEIAGAVLVNTSLRGLSPFWRRLRWQAWPHLLHITLQRDVLLREAAILKLTSRHGLEVPGRVGAWADIYRRHPVGRLNLLRQLWAAASYKPPAIAPGPPLLLLNSLGDRLVHPVCSQSIASRWDIALSVHPWAGHDLPLDDAGWTIRQVAEWLECQVGRP